MQPRPYQEEAVASLFYYFQNNNGNPVIAMPTGTGKSIVIAMFLKQVLVDYQNQRFLILTHVKELIKQNAEKLREFWPMAPIGIYSSGLGKKDIMQPIIFGGVASVVNNPELFGFRDLLIIDECHLLSQKSGSMYQRIILKLKEINPALKVIGLSATPFRLGQGKITDDGLFNDICFDNTGLSEFSKLIYDGYLAPLIPKKMNTEIDVSGVKIVNGDYDNKQLNIAIDKKEITYHALTETIEYGAARQSWLIFASGVEHAKHVSEMLNSFGISSIAIHSDMPDQERDKAIEAFRKGDYRAIVNNNILTTGFDHPPIDLIVMLRPTMSPGLWVQMLGRGTRPSPGKANCLVLDFAKNTERLGPINDPVIPKKKGKEPGVAPVKICEACGCYNHASARHCDNCGAEFKFKVKINKHASTQDLIKTVVPIVEYFDVRHIAYTKHQKGANKPILKVSYNCGLNRFNEYICVEHDSYAGTKARDWWRHRHWTEAPKTVDEALTLVSELKPPKKLRVWVNKQYPEILGYEY